jgi:dihydrofolate reductase
VVDDGGSTITFVTDGVEAAVARARAVAGARDVVSGGGAGISRELLDAGLVDELRIHLAYVLLVTGTRLFDLRATAPVELDRTRTVETPGTTHLTLRVLRRAA